MCVTEELAQSGDTRHEAVEGHVQLASSEALGEQLHYLAVALHPCWKRKCGGRFARVYFSRLPACVRACVCTVQIPTASSAELSSKGLMAPEESSSNWKKVD